MNQEQAKIIYKLASLEYQEENLISGINIEMPEDLISEALQVLQDIDNNQDVDLLKAEILKLDFNFWCDVEETGYEELVYQNSSWIKIRELAQKALENLGFKLNDFN